MKTAAAIPRSIAQLPFRRRGHLELLNLHDAARGAVDPDYASFGHGRVDELALVGRDGGGPPIVVRDALVLALHCADPGEALADDVELEFVLDEVAPGLSVSAALSRFLAVWLPALRGDERAVVLALCNPHRATLPRPRAAVDVPLYYGLGEVESWYHDGVLLHADTWREAR